jgi:PAS domain S-box-containing protein
MAAGQHQSLVRHALDTLPVTVAILDDVGDIVWTDRAWRKFAAENDLATAPDSIGVNYLDVTDDADDEDARAIASGLRAILSGDDDPFTHQYPCHAPNEKRWFLMWAAPFTYQDNRYVSLAHFDITERVQRERELRETTDRLDAIIEASPDPIVLTDRDGIVQLWNRSAERVFGWNVSEVVGQEDPSIPPEIREQYRADYERVLSGTSFEGIESVRRTKRGEALDVTVSAAPIHDAEGEAVGAMAAIRDVSELKRREEELERKTTELEALNRVVRHDIKNDMQVLIGWLEVLADHVDDEGEEMVEKVLDSTEHVLELTETARHLVEATVGDDISDTLEPVSLVSVLRTEIEKRREMYPEATFAVDGDLPGVVVLANGALSSVFGNLLNNAVQHSQGDDPTVELSVTEADDEVTVAVADDGPGVPDGQKESIFGKGEKGLDSEGTGIGLYLVKTLVEGYGGSVSVADNDPTGAVFTVTLPRATTGGSAAE